jgi:ATP-dependent helicase/nuclease subunit B
MREGYESRVFSIPGGVPFLRTLAKALIDGRLVEGFRFQPDDPMSLASATIYVPTRRAARALRSEFVDLLGVSAAILPTIRPLGETDDDRDFLEPGIGDSLDFLPPISSLERLLELARLILSWRNRLPEMLLDLHDGSPLVAPASPADAVWLARNLAELIDSIETEECEWDALKTIDGSDHALWWQLTSEFLVIASRFWPARLAELHKSSPARHRSHVLHAEASRILADQKGPDSSGPVIVAGSTGSMPATAALIAAIRQSSLGAVVLPGLDFDMNEAEFNLAGGMLADGRLDGGPASRSHPQYGLFHLLKRLGVRREDVTALGVLDPVHALRNRLLSVAMAPSEATSGWTEWRLAQDDEALGAAFADIALIEASNERTEAMAIAIALKLAVSGEAGGVDRQAALITPDRNLARRVGNELARFGIEADDSGGMPLLSSPQGSLTHLLLEAILRPGDPVALAGLLKHPLVRLSFEPAKLKICVAALELIGLRGGTSEIHPAHLVDVVRQALDMEVADRHPPNWRDALSGDAATDALELAMRIGRAVEPLAGAIVRRDAGSSRLSAELTFSEWAKRTGQVLEAFCTDHRGSLESLWSSEAGDALASLLAGLIDSGSTMVADGPQWIDVLTALMAGEGIKPRSMEHPRIFIWGTLEARLQAVDTVILGGMNEGVWPGQTSNNPLLSRMMKTSIGLEPPERRIGQNAHDFMMAAANPNLILTRSVRQGTAPTVASRFLQRMLAMTGEKIATGMKARGQDYLDLADALDRSDPTEAPGRPEPKPPAALQPKRYSFSEVGKLRRDPYAIYARRILRLDPLKPFNQDPGTAERGTIYHAIVDRFIREGHQPDTISGLNAMRTIADDVFDEARLPDHVDAVWRPRFFDVAKAFLDFETDRRCMIVEARTEVAASYPVIGDRLVLSGIADRIDLLSDGTADIIDYKTGSNPSKAQARALLDPQLALEAAALAAGGFRGIAARQPRNLIYVRLKPGKGFAHEQVNNDDPAKPGKENTVSAMRLAEDAIGEFVRLVTDLENGKHGFMSRLIPARQNDYGGEYDHLARVAEWSNAEEGPDGDD